MKLLIDLSKTDIQVLSELCLVDDEVRISGLNKYRLFCEYRILARTAKDIGLIKITDSKDAFTFRR